MGDRYRKWLFTFNNPLEHGWSREHLIEQINKTKKLVYWCMGEEIGEEETPHIHLFLYHENGVYFETMQKRFYGAHIDIVNGSCVDNRNYVFKDGEKFNKNPETGEYKYVDKRGKLHKGIHYDNTNEESGECPTETQGTRNDLHLLYNLIKSGMSNYEILEYNPQYMDKLEKIDRTRKICVEEVYRDKWREVETTYIWGVTGSGKTRSVMDAYGYRNVYRVTDYTHPFDGYDGQDIVLFEEFRSSLKVEHMLKYLDGYPVELPSRYNNKVACFTKVFICTNIDLRHQYRDIQTDCPETWNAFLRRIRYVKTYTDIDNYFVMDTKGYMSDMFIFFNNPFCGKQEDVDDYADIVDGEQLTLPLDGVQMTEK